MAGLSDVVDVAVSDDRLWVLHARADGTGALSALDPATQAVVVRVPLGRAPLGLTAAANGGVWVLTTAADNRELELLAVARDGSHGPAGVVNSHGIVPPAWPYVRGGLGRAGGALWWWSPERIRLLRIDPATLEAHQVPCCSGRRARFDDGRIWIHNDRLVWRLDLAREEIERVYNADTDQLRVIDVAGGFVWVEDLVSHDLLRVDLGSGAVAGRSPVDPAGATDVVVHGGRAWIGGTGPAVAVPLAGGAPWAAGPESAGAVPYADPLGGGRVWLVGRGHLLHWTI